MNPTKKLRWSTQRAMCQALLKRLAETSGLARAQVVSTLILVLDEEHLPALQRLLMASDAEPWVRIYALQELVERKRLSEADIDALLVEWLPLLDERRYHPIGAEQVAQVLSCSEDPARHTPKLSTLSAIGLRKLVKTTLPDGVVHAAVARWLSLVDFGHLADQELGWRICARADVRQRLFAQGVPLMCGPLRWALAKKTPAWIDAFFEGQPGLRRQAEAAFCLPLAAMSIDRGALVASLHGCLVDAVGEPRLTRRASNALSLVHQLGLREETRAWRDIHPMAYARLHPPQRRHTRALVEEIGAIDDLADQRLGVALDSDDPVERYLGVEQLGFLGGPAATLQSVSVSDPEPAIRVAALGGLAMIDADVDSKLVATATDAQAHVCVRAEALRWLGRLDPDAHRDVLIEALLHDHERFGADTAPAADEAAMWLAQGAGNEAMTALIEGHLEPASMDTSMFIRDSVRYRMGQSADPPSWQFSWRWRYLRRS